MGRTLVRVVFVVAIGLPTARAQTVQFVSVVPAEMNESEESAVIQPVTASLHLNEVVEGLEPVTKDLACGCDSYCSCELECPPCWEIRAEALLWTRDPGQNQPLAGGVIPQWNVVDMRFSYRFGARISAAHRINDRDQLELSWFGIDEWSATKQRDQFAQIIGPGYTYFAGGPHDFVYDSALQNAEVNIRRRLNHNWRGVVGLRAMQLSEHFQASSTGGTFAYSLNTNNHLYGVQGGLEGRLWECDWIRWDGFAKVAALWNQADGEAITANFGPGGSANNRDSSTAFVAEGGLNATIPLTDHISLSGGYQILWLNEVVRAPDLLAAPNTGAVTALVQANADILYHGGFLGFTGTY
ncbi:MAG: hypothetical protein QGG36_30245 [Pirellulaceae bacterium]|jgi:hypothetical protein|nr:hypothetical protein [Pirellulaceae bacterium]MDP7020117.1 hypothetical protein [Pirellulaceae bacterium]